MFGALDISTSALVAQRTRINTISANMANQFSVYDEQGNYSPYRRRDVIFAPGDPATGNPHGVHVREIKLDDAPFKQVFVGENHPLADEKGMMKMPNIEPMMEMINALEASRAYEANVTAAEATKSMLNTAIRLIA